MIDDRHPVVPWLTAPRRAWLYRVMGAAAPLSVLYGVVSETAAPLWLGFGGALLSTGTAALHTPTKEST